MQNEFLLRDFEFKVNTNNSNGFAVDVIDKINVELLLTATKKELAGNGI